MPFSRMERHRIVVLVVALMMTWLSAARSDDFYESRLRSGIAAYAAGHGVDAVDELRIAAFGFLDRPSLLVQALARLALAQQMVGRTNESTVALNRFVDVESRFHSYDVASIEPELRQKFEALLVVNVPAATLAAVPALARLAPGNRLAGGDAVSTTRSSAARKEAVQQEGRAPGGVAPPGTAAPNPAPTNAAGNPPPPASASAPVTPRSTASQATDAALQQARALMASKNFADATRLLRSAVNTEPSRRDLRLALLEATYLSHNSAAGVSQLPALLPFRDGEEPFMFYAAVLLYEGGNLEDARPLMMRAKPKLKSQPAVDYYEKKILGER